jgi:hypothetical protein
MWGSMAEGVDRMLLQLLVFSLQGYIMELEFLSTVTEFRAGKTSNCGSTLNRGKRLSCVQSA